MKFFRSTLLVSSLGLVALIIAAGNGSELVDVAKINSHIKIDCVYATDKNFTHKVVYKSPKCFLRAKVAQALSNVQNELEKEGLGLLVWDGFRPLEAQIAFWKICPDERYVSNPFDKEGKLKVDKDGKPMGGRHTRGTAVDLTLVDKGGNTLEMPTEFDDFSEKAWSDDQSCSSSAKKNRAKLKQVMEQHGFHQLPTEWWHFDYEGWEIEPVVQVAWDDLN